MKEDAEHLMLSHFTEYASYVITERAVPHMDGLKPVQRRILWTLKEMDDGKFHKVANVVGQTMALHPHGDAAISDALVVLANKGFLLDKQGNFGNLYTGDPAAASRYIETRLAPLAREVVFNKNLTEFVASYDGRKKEPVELPVKIPLLLLQGSDGIAVGLSTHVLPHNFVEVLEAEIAYFENREFELYPDFFSGGLIDVSDYQDGQGKVKVRAVLEKKDPKTLVIREIPYSTTTESLIKSIDDAAKKGKLRIESINDYTAENVEIEIKLPRGVYAEDLEDALYAYTDCETTLHPQAIVIKEGKPWECTVSSLLKEYAERLRVYLKTELEQERETLWEEIFAASLEAIFIEEKIYRDIEEVAELPLIHERVQKGFEPFHAQLLRVPTEEDRQKLFQIPIRRISRYDRDAHEKYVKERKKRLKEVEKQLKDIPGVAVAFLRKIVDAYGDLYPRKTKISTLGALDKRALEEKQVNVFYDMETGFVGTRVESTSSFLCSNYDKILCIFDDASYLVMSIPEKRYVPLDKKRKLRFVCPADKKTVLSALGRDSKTRLLYAKRFIVSQFILDKEYLLFPKGYELLFISDKENPLCHVRFVPKPRQRVAEDLFDFKEVRVMGVSAKGIRCYTREVRSVHTSKKEVEKLEPSLFKVSS